jgi:hypothetical protein
MNINSRIIIIEVQILITSHESQSFTHYIDFSSPLIKEWKDKGYSGWTKPGSLVFPGRTKLIENGVMPSSFN